MIKKVGDKYVLYSKSKKDGYRKRLGTFSSRKAAMKREKQIQYFKHIKENSMGSGAVAIGSGNAFSNKISKKAAIVKRGKKNSSGKEKAPKMASLEEQILRETIRKLINVHKAKYYEEIAKKTLEEQKLRRVIRALLAEAAETVPYKNTGLNTLNSVLDRIKKTITDAYKSLTTSKDQRDDFRKVLLFKIKKAMEQQDFMKSLESGKAAPAPIMVGDEAALEEADEQPADNAAAAEVPVPLGEPQKGDKEAAKEMSAKIAKDFASEKQDTKGGSEALEVCVTIIPQILPGRDSLKDGIDKEAFDKGIIPNISAVMDLAEAELQAVMSKDTASTTTPALPTEPAVPEQPEAVKTPTVPSTAASM